MALCEVPLITAKLAAAVTLSLAFASASGLARDAGALVDSHHAAFEWPSAQSQVLPDARLHDLVANAREAAAEAYAMANAAEDLAEDVEASLRRERLPSETVSDGVILTGKNAPNAGEFPDEVYLGRIQYETGAELTGSFKFVRYPGYSTWGFGVVKPSDAATMTSFKGEVAVPADIRARPSLGVASFRNGDAFGGLYYLYFGDTDALGVYENADGSLRFVGQLQTLGGSMQPKKGIVEDAKGRLLAVVLGTKE